MTIPARKLTTAITLALISTGYISHSNAAGFALIENSASGMGNAFAGAAAVAEDASTVWFNPAGMTRLSGSQMVAAGHFVSPTADFTNNGSALLTTAPISGPDDDGGASALVPNFYYVTEIGNSTIFGIGITVPYGLSTEYSSDWVGRYTATKSEVHVININPSFASKATDKLSVGFGLNIQYIEATLANQLDSAAICQGKLVPAGVPVGVCDGAGLTAANIGNQALDSSQSLSGDSLDFGWNAGLLYDLDKDSRLGVAYRSSIKHSLTGNVDFTTNANLQGVLDAAIPSFNLFSDTGITASLELPESLSVSYYRDIDSKLAIMADITWTRWSNFQELIIVFDNPYQSASTIPENWDDSYRYSLGINYKQDDKLTYRAGIAIDQTPIKSPEDRTPRIPGDDRTWLSFGIGYNMATDMSIDVGFSHLFVDDTPINNTDASFGHTVTGTYEADVNILSAQANFKF
ncbi:MAG: outer membrane protein transport protein [Gammaproteobacteria bacterium]|nr:outer membrane protein transport protein [Gammaproteobacteria bacterium]